MRRGLLILAGILLTRAAGASFPPVALLMPFTPPAHESGPGFIPAPVPDEDLYGPLPPAAAGGPSVAPGLARPSVGPTGQSEGYTRGSSYNSAQDGRLRPAPTLNLSVPLQ